MASIVFPNRVAQPLASASRASDSGTSVAGEQFTRQAFENAATLASGGQLMHRPEVSRALAVNTRRMPGLTVDAMGAGIFQPMHDQRGANDRVVSQLLYTRRCTPQDWQHQWQPGQPLWVARRDRIGMASRHGGMAFTPAGVNFWLRFGAARRYGSPSDGRAPQAKRTRNDNSSVGHGLTPWFDQHADMLAATSVDEFLERYNQFGVIGSFAGSPQELRHDAVPQMWIAGKAPTVLNYWGANVTVGDFLYWCLRAVQSPNADTTLPLPNGGSTRMTHAAAAAGQYLQLVPYSDGQSPPAKLTASDIALHFVAPTPRATDLDYVCPDYRCEAGAYDVEYGADGWPTTIHRQSADELARNQITSLTFSRYENGWSCLMGIVTDVIEVSPSNAAVGAALTDDSQARRLGRIAVALPAALRNNH